MSPRSSEGERRDGHERQTQVDAAQVRLLYDNLPTGIAVTAIAAPLLAFVQTFFVPSGIVLAWLAYILVVTSARFLLMRRYRTVNGSGPFGTDWHTAFAVGAGLAGVGWGGAGILLYPPNDPISQVFLVFVIGGMMLGGCSLLAPKAETFLAFLVPAGLLPALRLIYQGDKEHVSMGLLALVFTISAVVTTWRFHLTIASSLELQFENRDLLRELQVAHEEAVAANQHLETHVRERTAKLEQSTALLRSEIKQRESMEEELLRVRNLDSLGVLAGGIAHDFNNYLTVIQGNIDLAKMQLDSGAPISQILDQTTGACQRAAYSASQLLTFAKGGAPIRAVVSVAQLVSDAVRMARADSTFRIHAEIAEDLLCAEADAGQVSQVIHNILLNAKQSMPQGGDIEVRAENVTRMDKDASPKPHVRIKIRDHGTGIPPEILPHIFDPYFTTKPGNSGLGLATAYAIVARHGGSISLDSKGEGGSMFTVELPATLKSLTSVAQPGSSPRSGTGRLLVMDDEEALRKLLERVLTMLGYEVQSARDGAEAIAMYEEARALGRGFDAVLLDVTIQGGMGGIEAAARLKELDPAAKLIVTSGYSAASVMSKFQEFGFNDVIPKPWKTAQLGDVFRRVLVPKGERKSS